MINLENVTVTYNYHRYKSGSLKEVILKTLLRKKEEAIKFNALDNVSIKIEEGESVGFIGHNGAGKSTLLNVLARTMAPSQGKVEITGTIDSLRNLGAGFDPELNAIENIYLYKSLLGYKRKEIKDRVPAILDFAALGEFAQTPIKYYSSGMFARLGFATAIDSDPDILLIDEVINVGDESFINKCHEVFKNFHQSGKTLVLVSHELEFIQNFCDKVGVLKKGCLEFIGEPKEAVEYYRGSFE